ncbi:MAG: dihydrodipicolinate synthase family protein [Marinilabiliaceae bacterium]|nr:dihydrodipicolinate synthase family protein [Marinilabiliaceae bacterium]
MKTEKKYKGVIIPMITPVDDKFQIDVSGVENIIVSFISAGVDPFILGTTGESFSVSEKEKDKLVAASVKALNGKGMLYAGISGNCVSETIIAAKKYKDLGVDVLVAHQPFYFLMSDSQLLSYFENLADSCDLPLIMYNNPITTKQSISIDVVEKLSYHSNIYGFKDSERGIERLDKAIALWKDREDFSHLLGWAAQSSYSLLKGSDGIIPSTGNLTPGLYRSLYDAAINGDSDTANKLQVRVDEISAIYQKDRTINQSIPVLKAMMEIKGICKRYALPPMFTVNNEDMENIEQVMNDLNV